MKITYLLKLLLAMAGCIVALYIGNYFAVHLGARSVGALVGSGYSLLFPWQGLVPPLPALTSYTFLLVQILIYSQYRLAVSLIVGACFSRLPYWALLLPSLGWSGYVILRSLQTVSEARNASTLYALIIIPYVLVPVGMVLGKKLGDSLRKAHGDARLVPVH